MKKAIFVLACLTTIATSQFLYENNSVPFLSMENEEFENEFTDESSEILRLQAFLTDKTYSCSWRRISVGTPMINFVVKHGQATFNDQNIDSEMFIGVPFIGGYFDLVLKKGTLLVLYNTSKKAPVVLQCDLVN